jgi:[ribosomal protein S5]-alanine N-acetyltransferase
MQLTTDRLVLREFQMEDWPAVLAYQTHPDYLQYYHWTERTEADVRAFVEMFVAQQQKQPRTQFQLAVLLRSSHQLIGNCGIRLASPGAHEADIGYEIAPQHWGNGYATEAAHAIVHYGFTELNLHRIWSWCIADNRGSVRVLEKLGMYQEGRLRHKERFKGRWWDVLTFGILKDEWQQLHAKF